MHALDTRKSVAHTLPFSNDLLGMVNLMVLSIAIVHGIFRNLIAVNFKKI